MIDCLDRLGSYGLVDIKELKEVGGEVFKKRG